MLLLEQDVAPLNLDAVGGSEPVDVTGAGDTVIATYALAVASGASFPDAARLANYAGGLVVMKRGTATVTPQELEESVAILRVFDQARYGAFITRLDNSQRLAQRCELSAVEACIGPDQTLSELATDSSSSCGVTVAVPRFITTSPPA